MCRLIFQTIHREYFLLPPVDRSWIETKIYRRLNSRNLPNHWSQIFWRSQICRRLDAFPFFHLRSRRELLSEMCKFFRTRRWVKSKNRVILAMKYRRHSAWNWLGQYRNIILLTNMIGYFPLAELCCTETSTNQLVSETFIGEFIKRSRRSIFFFAHYTHLLQDVWSKFRKTFTNTRSIVE